MTALEFKNQFLLEYDAHGTKEAPGMTDYSISYWLTRAQNDLVKNMLSPKSNRMMEGFEDTESRRRKLSHLLKPAAISVSSALTFDSNINFNASSKRFDISSFRVLEIKTEWLTISPDACDGITELKVVPVTHDELLEVNRNPFRKPSKWQAWRLDMGSDVQIFGGGFEKPIEIVSIVPYTQYKMRFVKRPYPIIVGDLTLEDPELSIDGETDVHDCELDESFHDEIVARAVTYATEANMSPRFQSSATLETTKID